MPLIVLEINPNSQLTAVAQIGNVKDIVVSKSKLSIPATNSNQKSAKSFSYKRYLLGTDRKQNFLWLFFFFLHREEEFDEYFQDLFLWNLKFM